MAARTGLYTTDLELDTDEIRVLNLLSGASDSPITCELSKVYLPQEPQYNALSYVWGDPTKAIPIIVNGTEIQVTANLESALRHLRDPQDALVIWIDAICINQANIDERNAQVRLMGEIYRNAATVFLWIGEGNLDSDAAFDSMETIAGGTLDDQARRGTASFHFSVGDRPWFSRVWILQEMALAAQEPIVVCGTRKVAWSIFMGAWKVIAREFFAETEQIRTVASPDGSHDSVEVLAKIKIDVLDDLRQSVHAGVGSDLRHLLIISRTSESTDPRDRIYGLLGMLKYEDDDEVSIEIDYNLSTAEVYTQAISHLFSKGIGPFYLSGVWLPGTSPSIGDLPSWVPDFSRQVYGKAVGISANGFNPPSPPSVSGPGAGAHNGKVLDDRRTLQVEVLPVDVIDDVIVLDNEFPKAVLQLPVLECLVATARTRGVSDERLRPYFKRYRSSEPLWRVLISNRKFTSGYDTAPECYETQYKLLRASLDDLPTQLHDTVGVMEPKNEYKNALLQHLPGRAFFVTANGFFGLAVPEIRPGDEVTIWFGATAPFIVRHEGDFCQLVGAAYVSGIMAGEMVDGLYCEDLLDSKTLLVK